MPRKSARRKCSADTACEARPHWKCCIPKEIRSQLKVLGSGQSGEVLGNHSLAYKSLDLDPLRKREKEGSVEREEASRDALEDFETEAAIALDMSEAGAGPKVKEIFVSEEDNYGVIVMEKLHKPFDRALGMIGTVAEFRRVERMIEKAFRGMISAGYACVDMRPENVMVKLSENGKRIIDVRLIDFGGDYCARDQDASSEEKEIKLIALKLLFRWNVWMIAGDEYHLDDVEVFDQVDPESPLYTEAINWIMGNRAAIRAMAWYLLFTSDASRKERDKLYPHAKKVVKRALVVARETPQAIPKEEWSRIEAEIDRAAPADLAKKIEEARSVQRSRRRRSAAAIAVGLVAAGYVAKKLYERGGHPPPK